MKRQHPRKAFLDELLNAFVDEKKSLIQFLDGMDKHLVEQALDRVECNITEAARFLGISRGAMQAKMKKYGIELVHTTRKAG